MLMLSPCFFEKKRLLPLTEREKKSQKRNFRTRAHRYSCYVGHNVCNTTGYTNIFSGKTLFETAISKFHAQSTTNYLQALINQPTKTLHNFRKSISSDTLDELKFTPEFSDNNSQNGPNRKIKQPPRTSHCIITAKKYIKKSAADTLHLSISIATLKSDVWEQPEPKTLTSTWFPSRKTPVRFSGGFFFPFLKTAWTKIGKIKPSSTSTEKQQIKTELTTKTWKVKYSCKSTFAKSYTTIRKQF